MTTGRSRELMCALLLTFAIGIAPSVAAGGRWISKGQPPTRVTALVMSASNPEVLYLAAYGAGVYQSVDAGETWKAINTGLLDTRIVSLTTDPVSAALFAGTESGRIFTTTDGGGNWNPISSWSPKAVPSVALAAERDAVYALAGGSIFRTSNAGTNWSESRVGLTGSVEALATVPSNPSAIFATTSDGLFTTSDRGESWRHLPIPGVQHVGAVAVSDDGRTIYANSGDFHTSCDGGRTWISVGGHGLQNAGSVTIDRLSSSTAWATISDPGGRTPSVYRTNDTGRTWTRLDFSEEIHALLLAGNTAFVATASGIYKSLDAAEHWKPVNAGLSAGPVYDVALDAAHPSLMYAATAGGIFKTTDAGGAWKVLEDTWYANSVAIDPNNSSVVFASTLARARKTMDGGATWTGISPNPAKLAGARAFAIDPSNSTTVYAVLVEGGLSKSTDGGSTFSLINSGLPEDFYYGFDSSAFAIDPSSPSTLFASSFGISRSTNGGVSWQLVMPGAQLYSASAIAVDPGQAAFVYATGSDHGVYRSSDGGLAWERIQNGLTNEWFRDVIVDPADGRNVYVAGGRHVYKSADHGQTWTIFSEGLPPAAEVMSLAIDSTGRFLAAATLTGVFTLALPVGVALPPELHAQRLESDPGRLKRLLEQVRSLRGSAPPVPGASAGLLFAVSGNAAGALGTHFRSDVTLMNGGPAAQDVVAVWLAAGSDGTDAPSLRLTLPPSAITVSDFVGKMGLEGMGSLLVIGVDSNMNVDADADLTGFSRIWTAGPGARGSVSQSLPATDVASLGVAGTASAIGLRMDSDFRTNVGVVNLGATPQTFLLTLTGERKSTTLSLTVAPFSLQQVPIPEGDYGALTALFQVTGAASPWVAYGASVDNVTGDGWASQALPVRAPTSAQPQPGSAGIAGTVYTQSGACLRGAVVEVLDGARAGEKWTQKECESYWDYTGYLGYSISLPAGTTVRIRASMPGYRSKEETFTATTAWADGGSNVFLDRE